MTHAIRPEGKRLLWSLTLLAAVLACGCFSVKVKTGAPQKGGDHEELEWHFLWGLTDGHVNASECKDGISRVEVKHPWWSVACVFPLTLGLVAVTHTRYYCADSSTPDSAPQP